MGGGSGIIIGFGVDGADWVSICCGTGEGIVCGKGFESGDCGMGADSSAGFCRMACAGDDCCIARASIGGFSAESFSA